MPEKYSPLELLILVRFFFLRLVALFFLLRFRLHRGGLRTRLCRLCLRSRSTLACRTLRRLWRRRLSRLIPIRLWTISFRLIVRHWRVGAAGVVFWAGDRRRRLFGL